MYDCIVIGGGPAGLTAAIYLARFRRSVLVINKGHSRMTNAPRIKNLIGYAEGISGNALLRRLKRQARLYSLEVLKGEAIISKKRGLFEVNAGEKTYSAKFVVVATGIRDKQPSGINWRELCHYGLLKYCPVCDGFEQTNKKIAVLINSNAGFKKVIFISQFSKKIIAVVTKDIVVSSQAKNKMRRMGIKIAKGKLVQLKQHPLRKTLVVKLEHVPAFEVHMAYVELGSNVAASAFKQLRGLCRLQNGRLKTNRHQETSVKRLYAAGDCTNSLAQVSVAAAEGAIAATDIHNQLNKE